MKWKLFTLFFEAIFIIIGILILFSFFCLRMMVQHIARKVMHLFCVMMVSTPLLSQTKPLDSSKNTGMVVVHVSGMKTKMGYISIGVFSKKCYQYQKEIVVGAEVPCQIAGITQTFASILPGYYAVAVFHDKNSNRKHDKNFLGIPTEPYGFSMNKRGVFGPPSFEEIKFEVEAGKIANVHIFLN